VMNEVREQYCQWVCSPTECDEISETLSKRQSWRKCSNVLFGEVEDGREWTRKKYMRRSVVHVKTRIAYMWMAISFLQWFRIPTLLGWWIRVD
jgi:hypothetical protein